MTRPNYDPWLIPIGLFQPIVGYFVLGIVARRVWLSASDLLFLIPAVPLMGAIAVVLLRALGVGFSQAGVAVFVGWMVVVAFVFWAVFLEILGAC
jgi:hypothetical protein